VSQLLGREEGPGQSLSPTISMQLLLAESWEGVVKGTWAKAREYVLHVKNALVNYAECCWVIFLKNTLTVILLINKSHHCLQIESKFLMEYQDFHMLLPTNLSRLVSHHIIQPSEVLVLTMLKDSLLTLVGVGHLLSSIHSFICQFYLEIHPIPTPSVV
jgi:hypothetical protein